MKLFVCSDVHGNLRALEAVLDRRRRDEAHGFLFLGDAIGYGAHPGECLERLLAIPGAILIRGNHDAALLDVRARDDMSEFAVAALLWQERKLAGRFDAAIRDRFLLQASADSFLAAHGSPLRPEEWQYVYTSYGAADIFLARDFRVCFIGHTHLPALFSAERGELELPPGETLRLDPRDRYLINPGSVGQPRDGDPRASCLVYDGDEGTATLERCVYDTAAEAAEMREVGLPVYLADRLLVGG